MKKTMKSILIANSMLLLLFATMSICTTANEPISLNNPNLLNVTCNRLPPTVVVINSDVDDGYIYNSGLNYNIAHESASGTTITDGYYAFVGQSRVVFPPIAYEIDRPIFYFNTSVIPASAIISSAKLTFSSPDASPTNNFDIIIMNGQPTYPHKPMVGSDYNYTLYSGDGGKFNTSNLPAIGTPFNISLNAIGIGWINRTGTTKFMLRSSRDINSNQPMGFEFILLYTFEWSLHHSACPPKLTVTWRNKFWATPIDSMFNGVNGFII